MRRASGRSTSSNAVVITKAMTEAEMAGKMVAYFRFQWLERISNVSVDGDRE
jgi:hypothetical protein